MSLVWSLDKATQVVMDGLIYYPFHFVEKKNNPEGLTSCTQGRRIFYCPHGICFRGLHRKHCFKMEWVLLLLLYGTKSRENNGPNGHTAQCMTQVSFIKNRYIQRYWPATNWILCLCFCCGSTVCHWWRFCLFVVNYILNFYRPRLIKLAKI